MGCSQSCSKNYCSHTENSPEDTITTQPGDKSVKKEEVKWMMMKEEEDLKSMVSKCLKEIREDSEYEKNGDKKNKKSEKKMIVEVEEAKKDKKNQKNKEGEGMKESKRKTIEEDEMETKNTENDTKKEKKWKRNKKDDEGDSKHKEKGKEKGNDKKKQESVAPEDVPTQSDKKTKKFKYDYETEDNERESIREREKDVKAKLENVAKRAEASGNEHDGEIADVESVDNSSVNQDSGFEVSKMSFVLKQTFDDFEADGSTNGDIHNHFGIDWRLYFYRYKENLLSVWLQCPNLKENGFRKVDAVVKLRRADQTIIAKDDDFVAEAYKSDCGMIYGFVEEYALKRHCIDGKLHLKCHVEVDYIKKFKPFSRDFGEKSKKFSDVILDVIEKKFHVSKLSLASHCTHFEALFLGNHDESNNPEIKLDEYNYHAFQYFMELIHGVSSVDDDSVEDILRLAKKYGSETALRRCEDFLLKNSEEPLVIMFTYAKNYKLKKLMNKVIAEMKNATEMQSILLYEQKESELSKMDSDWLVKLLLKSLSFSE